MHECIWVLSICYSNPFEATIGKEGVSCLEKKQTAPYPVFPSWQKTSTLLPEDQDMLPLEAVGSISLILPPWN